MSERALELLALPEDGVPRFLLDIGIKNDPFDLLMMSNVDSFINSFIGINRVEEQKNLCINADILKHVYLNMFR